MDKRLFFENAYFIIGTAYAGKSTMVKELAKRHSGIACEENYHDNYPEKQFLYKLILEEPDPEYAMQNYRKGLELINSKETYDEFLNSGFTTILRDENRTIDETVVLAEKAFGL